MPKVTPQMLRLCELLEDGEWHDYEQIVHDAGKAIPPGRARREAERNRIAASRRAAPAERQAARSDSELIRIGRRSIVYDLLRRDAFQVDGSGAGRKVRMVQMPEMVRRHKEDVNRMAQRQYCLIVESQYGSERGVEAVYGPATASWAQDYQSVLRSRLRDSQGVSVTIAELQPVPPPR